MPAEIFFFLLSSGIAEGAAALVIANAIAFTGVALASYAINSALAPKNSNNKDSSAQGTASISSQTVSGTDPAAPWKIVYGNTRIGGNVAFKAISFSDGVIIENHVVPSLAPHTFVVAHSGRYVSTSLVRHIITVADVDGNQSYEYVTLTPVVADPGPTEYVVSSGFYTFHSSLAAENVDVQYFAQGAGTSKYLNIVLVLCAHPSLAIDHFLIDDKIVPLDVSGGAMPGSPYAGYINVKMHLGIPNEPADPLLMQMMPSVWTSRHTFEGHTYVYIRLLKGGAGNPWEQGIGNFSFIGRWKSDVYDPRTNTYGYTDNWGLCVADYMRNPLIGISANFNEEDLIAAANASDEDVFVSALGTNEKRYTLVGVVSLGDAPRNILPEMIAAGGGRLVYVGGEWRIHAGVYEGPVASYTESDFREPMKVTTRVPKREAFNVVSGKFLGPQNNWQPADVPLLVSQRFIDEDGERLPKDTVLRYTDSPYRGQRLFKIDLLRARQQITAELPLKLRGYLVRPPDVISLSSSKSGWTNKPFEVTELSLSLAGTAPGVTLIVRETDPSVYDWSTSEESAIDPAPNTNLPDPLFVGRPGIPRIFETLYYVPGSGVRVKAVVDWAPPAKSRDVSYRLEWKKQSASVWNVVTLQTTSAEILDIEEDDYFFRVQAVSPIGIRSVWAQRDVSFIGLAEPPQGVVALAVISLAGVGYAQWAATVDLDVRYGGSVSIRHSSLTSGAEWELGIGVGTAGGAEVRTPVPLLRGTYMAKFIDSAGNASYTAAKYVMTDEDLQSFSIIDETEQAPDFTGNKINVVYDAGLDGIRIDDLMEIGAGVTPPEEWPNINAQSVLTSTGSYEFDEVLDLGTAGTRRFEAEIAASSYDDGQLIDSRMTLIDSWDDVDGLSINDCHAVLYASLTNDEPVGSPSPTWGPWKPFISADFTCRAAIFKIDLGSEASTHNIVITTLTVRVKT